MKDLDEAKIATRERRVARAKELSESWNTLRKTIKEPFHKSELTNLAIEHSVPYSNVVPAFLERDEYIIPVGHGFTRNNIQVIKYEFDKPIHYSFFINTQRFAPSGRKRNKKEEQQSSITKSVDTKNNDRYLCTLDIFSDKGLVEELRSRGYEVTAIKTTTIEL